jgi:hypothetical protein
MERFPDRDRFARAPIPAFSGSRHITALTMAATGA